MRHVRDIVHHEHCRHVQPDRRGVRGREKDVQAIGCDGRRQLHLLPPRAAGTGDLAGRELPVITDHRQRIDAVEDKFMLPCAVGGRPFAQQSGEIAPDAGWASAELARIDADPHVTVE